MIARIIIMALLASALAAGGLMYYQQVYAYYDEITVAEDRSVQMTLLAYEMPEDILFEDFQGIDADSSPLRYRACFQTPDSHAMLTETYVIVDDAEPRVAPRWFDCFDATEIGEAIEDGSAIVFLGTRNIEYGIDRVVAVMDDGRGFVWHQINECGEVVFDGNSVPENCPPQPQPDAEGDN